MSSESLTGSVSTIGASLTARIFDGPAAQRLMPVIEDGLAQVEEALASELSYGDQLADVTARYLYEAGGKRVRPMLTLLTAQLGEGTSERVVDGAVALELTHLGSLYHDDVMDGADVRRHVPAAHAVWGNNLAILTGDLLFSRASQIMSRHGSRSMRLQADTFERLVLGQMHETVGPGDGDDPQEFYLQVLADKTGSLIAASAQLGALFANAPERFQQPLVDFGERVGVAFQLLDDVIDLSADSEATGKLAGTDLRAGVATMPFLLLGGDESAEAKALKAQIEADAAAIAAGADPSIMDDAVIALREHPVTAQTMSLAKSWSDRAQEALADLPPGDVRDSLSNFAAVLADRNG